MRLAEQKANAVAAALGGTESSRSNIRRESLTATITQLGSKMLQRANTWVQIPGVTKKVEQAPQVRMDDRLVDPGFVKSVCLLMADPRIVETFSVFDKDSSGSISTNELSSVITMLQLASNKTDLETMLVELDINQDGGIDLWEFCVYLQKSRERRMEEESNWELDQAFQLFETDAGGRIDEAELKRIMTNPLSGMPLDDTEWAEMWENMVGSGLANPEGKITLSELRKHECWQAKQIGSPSPTTTPRHDPSR